MSLLIHLAKCALTGIALVAFAALLFTAAVGPMYWIMEANGGDRAPWWAYLLGFMSSAASIGMIVGVFTWAEKADPEPKP